MAEAELVERMVDIGGTQLRLSGAGHGTPTVVLDSGLGEGAETWTKVQTQVAAFTRVCAYDRAGVGKSGPPLFEMWHKRAHELEQQAPQPAAPAPAV
jgi:pimeloyl-ACP methyl ester carboxylesterase